MSYNNTRTYMRRMRFPMKIFVLFIKSQFLSKLSAVKFHYKINIYIYHVKVTKALFFYLYEIMFIFA